MCDFGGFNWNWSGKIRVKTKNLRNLGAKAMVGSNTPIACERLSIRLHFAQLA